MSAAPSVRRCLVAGIRAPGSYQHATTRGTRLMVREGDDARDASKETLQEMHGTRPRLRSQGRDDARSVRTMSHCRD